jgi:hypothetical protein
MSIFYGRVSSQACSVRNGSSPCSATGKYSFRIRFLVISQTCRFPLDVVFRIYDNCLASGIEAIFGFSIMLLKKNEDLLLALKFDEILGFLNNRLFDRYKASEVP